MVFNPHYQIWKKSFSWIRLLVALKLCRSIEYKSLKKLLSCILYLIYILVNTHNTIQYNTYLESTAWPKRQKLMVLPFFLKVFFSLSHVFFRVGRCDNGDVPQKIHEKEILTSRRHEIPVWLIFVSSMFSSVMITEWNFLIWSLNAPLVMKSRLHSEQEWLGGTNPSPCILAECSRSLCMRVKPLPEFFLKKIIHYFVLQLLSKIISQKKPVKTHHIYDMRNSFCPYEYFQYGIEVIVYI